MSVNNLPPQNIEAEEAVLGGILLDPAAIGEVRAILRQEHFYIPCHRQIYRAAESLDEAGLPTDLMHVTSWLCDNEVLDKIGGQGKLAQLVDRTVSAVNIGRYSQLVLEKYERRMLIRAGNELIQNCYDGHKKLEESRDKLEADLTSLGVGGVQGEFPVAYNYATREGFLDPKQGIKSGFYELDSLIGGFQKAEYIIVAGRPSTGKTAWALQAARHIASSLPCVFFSLEMTGEQLTTRLVCGDVGIPSDKIRKGHITNQERTELEKAIEGYRQIPLVISDVPTGISQMLAYSNSVRRLKGGLGAVCIDYLQLLKYDGDNPTVGVSKLSAQLKAMAKKLDVPLIVLSQLSRSVESRNNKRPINSDLRDSGCLTGDTLITLADSGAQVELRELIGKSGFNVWAVNESTMKLEKAPVSNAFSSGVKFVFELRTLSGKSIKATGNHKFLTIDGWKQLDHLWINESVALGYIHASTDQAQWDTIVSIEPIGDKEVFDLTVPELHNFVANGIVVHNSLEQDSDLIIMLYRDEYYNKDTEEPNTAELIVTKHRTGPTGTVKLEFKRGQFYNPGESEW